MRTFVEAVRRGGISPAARALGMTQPAASQQIGRLEDQFGAPVLTRQRRGVEPTELGLRFFEIADRAVTEIDALMREQQAVAARPAIRLRTDYAFSALWLVPRLHDFRALHPETEIQTVATQRFHRAEMQDDDLAVAFGVPGEFGADAIRLLPEEVVPVCSRALLAEADGRSDLTALGDCRLIHLDAEPPFPWLDWEQYLVASGEGRRSPGAGGDLRFNTYSLVIQAAIEGEGVALGWKGLVDSHMRSGMLVAAGPGLGSDRGYWLIPPRRKTASNMRLVSWLASLAPDSSDGASAAVGVR